MNNQNGQVLTPKVAQELIQDLFAGQTLQRKHIVEQVDEAHAARGGQPPRAKNHPVPRALAKMKQDGLATNSNGRWSIFLEESAQSEESDLITSLDAFMAWARKFERGKYVFRGVPSAAYGIQASAYRRPEEEKRDFEKFLQINKDLIREARLRGYDEKDGRELKELEILADLQHFRASTCLIDFSYNAQVALWFACQPDRKNPEDLSNGRVFAVRNQPPKFTEIELTLIKLAIFLAKVLFKEK